MTGAAAAVTAMLSVAARSGPFAPYLSAAAHAVPGPLKPLAPAVARRAEKVPLELKRPLLCRESMSGRSARGGLVAGASLNGAGRGAGRRGPGSGGAARAGAGRAASASAQRAGVGPGARAAGPGPAGPGAAHGLGPAVLPPPSALVGHGPTGGHRTHRSSRRVCPRVRCPAWQAGRSRVPS